MRAALHSDHCPPKTAAAQASQSRQGPDDAAIPSENKTCSGHPWSEDRGFKGCVQSLCYPLARPTKKATKNQREVKAHPQTYTPVHVRK